MSDLSRREMLELTLAAGVALGVPAAVAADKPQPPASTAGGRRPKNIIFMVSDGMSTGAVSLAEVFSQQTRQRGTQWAALFGDTATQHGLFDTSSLNSLVTDSAAAATAWGSGTRVFNGAINALPDGQRLEAIGVLARQSGRRVGLVTTTTLTHATPAGFVASQPSRDDEAEIAPQYAAHVDVLLGGGRKFFEATAKNGSGPTLEAYKKAGYAVMTHRDELPSGNPPEKMLGLFADGHLPYSIDHANVAEIAARVPTLAELTRLALRALATAGEGFLLQVEGGRVDHAAHANDIAALLHDQIAFDDALAVVLDFASEHPDTLVVVTSDHGNSNPGLNGMGSGYGKTSDCFQRIAKATSSFERLQPILAESRGEAVATLEKHMGVTLDDRQRAALSDALDAKFDSVINRQHASLVGVLGQVLSNHFGVGWTGTTHTQDWTLVSARGPGSEAFNRLMRNDEAFRVMAELWNINHRNPVMTLDEARRFAVAAPVHAPHWA